MVWAKNLALYGTHKCANVVINFSLSRCITCDNLPFLEWQLCNFARVLWGVFENDENYNLKNIFISQEF
jgi:hypothetical protein